MMKVNTLNKDLIEYGENVHGVISSEVARQLEILYDKNLTA